MVMGMNPFYNQQQPNLAQVNDATLKALSQQGNPQFSHAAMLEQAAAQQQMQRMAVEKNIEVPKVNFYPSRHADPRKARRADIRQAYRLLKPTKRSILDPRRWLGSKYRYNKDTAVCAVDGCDVMELIQYDNLYSRISDEETGRTLWEMYWQNPITGEPEAFIAREGVTSGRKLRATYCPEHLHLYHLLCKWEAEEEKEAELRPSRFRDKIKKGVSIVTVPVSTVTGNQSGPTHPMITKYEPFFAEISADARGSNGITMQHYTNPVTGENDITTITFDMRMFQKELLEMNRPNVAFQDILNQQAQVLNPPPTIPEAVMEGAQ